MPNRILREGILTSERVALLNWQEEVFYRRLMSVVDDFGRFHANPKLLRAACYPLLIDKVSDADIGKWLTSCVTAALVSVYPAPDGKRYLQLLDFRQQARATTSKFPQMNSECAADAMQTLGTGAADAPVFGVEGVVVKPPLASQGSPFALPDWIPAEPWAAFIAMRKAKGKRAPFTDAARDGIVAELAKLKRAGHQPGDVLTASVVNGWSGVFAPKTANGSAEPAWRTEQRERNEAFLGPAAARKTATVIDLEAHDAATLRLG